MALTGELYDAIVRIMDERFSQIKVTREDFDKLTKTVSDLSIAVRELADGQKVTDQRLRELAEAQKQTDQTLRETQKVTDQRLRELAEAQKQTDQTLQRMQEAIRELATAQRGTDQAVGRLSDMIGHDLESMARVNVPDWLRLYERVKVPKLERRVFRVDNEDVEVDLFGEGMKGRVLTAIVGEAKSKIHGRDVEAFSTRVERIKKQLDGRVVKIMFGFWIHPSAEEVARKLQVHVIAPPGTYTYTKAAKRKP